MVLVLGFPVRSSCNIVPSVNCYALEIVDTGVFGPSCRGRVLPIIPTVWAFGSPLVLADVGVPRCGIPISDSWHSTVASGAAVLNVDSRLAAAGLASVIVVIIAGVQEIRI